MSRQRVADALQTDFGIEVCAVTLNSVGDGLRSKFSGRREFGVALFNRWGLGSADTNNGLMFLLIMDTRSLESFTGSGMENALSDSWLKEMQDKHMVPHFRSGDFGAGLIEGLRRCDRKLRQQKFIPELGARGESLALQAGLVPGRAPEPQPTGYGGGSCKDEEGPSSFQTLKRPFGTP